jgi:hypothetical protein
VAQAATPRGESDREGNLLSSLVAGDRNRGADDDVIRRRQIGNAREMDIEHCDQRSGLRELVLQFIADPKFQSRSLRAATLGCAIVLVLRVSGQFLFRRPQRKVAWEMILNPSETCAPFGQSQQVIAEAYLKREA